MESLDVCPEAAGDIAVEASGQEVPFGVEARQQRGDTLELRYVGVETVQNVAEVLHDFVDDVQRS
eukprot:6343207-Alexandrium_andersonii.AAC.1